MSLGSLLAASEPMLSPGAEAVVCVAVATLWTSPDRIRPIDEPALSVPSRPRDWVESMTAADREDLVGRTLSQLLLGERVQVLDLQGYWAKVVALSQPSSLDPRGYPGWLPTDHLSTLEGIHAAGVRVAARHRDRLEVEDRTGVWHVVVATATALRDDPDAALAVPGVTFGTRLMALGAPHDGWLPVAVPGRFEPAWAIEDDVAAVPPTPPADRADVLEWADRLRDVPYIWGGTSAHGVDCSGLVHLSWRRFGVVLPRDA
ncbi:MAG TPA: NlpC/P60 family protein, partial [Micromonosporaceae bacterium]